MVILAMCGLSSINAAEIADDQTARIHCRAQRRRGMAARGAGAAGGARTADRCPYCARRKRSCGKFSAFLASACELRLDRWPKRADGPSVGRPCGHITLRQARRKNGNL